MRLDSSLAYELEALTHQQAVLNLVVGTARDRKRIQELTASRAAMSFSDVVRDGQRRSAHLRRNPESLVGWEDACEAVDVHGEIYRLLPENQIAI